MPVNAALTAGLSALRGDARQRGSYSGAFSPQKAMPVNAALTAGLSALRGDARQRGSYWGLSEGVTKLPLLYREEHGFSEKSGPR
jgi:hypothetical protein